MRVVVRVCLKKHNLMPTPFKITLGKRFKLLLYRKKNTTTTTSNPGGAFSGSNHIGLDETGERTGDVPKPV